MRKMVIPLMAVMLITLAIPVKADQLDEIEGQKNYIENRINSLSKQQQVEKNKLNALQDNKKKVQSEQARIEKEYQQTVSAIKSADKELETYSNKLDKTEEEYEQQMELLKTRLKVMYENSQGGYLEVLLESQNISDLMSRVEMIQLVSEKDKKLIEDIKKTKEDIERSKKIKEGEQQKIKKKASDKKKTLNNLQISRSNIDEETKKINSRLSQLESEENNLIKKSQELTSQIKSLQRNVSYTGGEMLWPAPSSGLITSPFGYRNHPVLKKNKFHTGIDIGAGSGSSIVAANSGVVMLAGWQSGYGNTIIIDHGGGKSTLYAHCSSLLVSEGAEVIRGAVIARVGSTGLSTGPHLHFEVREDGEPVNPVSYVGG